MSPGPGRFRGRLRPHVRCRSTACRPGPCLATANITTATATGWQRAAVPGANDGIVSTARLVLGVVAAGKLMVHDALGAHARDELGASDATATRPTQAALASAPSFVGGATLPIGVVVVTAPQHLIVWVSLASLGFLAGLGAVSARVGGAPVRRRHTDVAEVAGAVACRDVHATAEGDREMRDVAADAGLVVESLERRPRIARV
jgi:hypothetical protein